MTPTVVFITSGQPSLNPRLVKEADTLAALGYHVTVIYQYWNDWGTNIDEVFLTSKKWKAIRIGGSPHSERFNYWISRIKFKMYNKLAPHIPIKLIAEKCIVRSFRLLLIAATKIKADLYIAHNLGALPIAVIASKQNKSKCGFDAEDFHRQEITDNVNSVNYQLAKFIEDKYLPQINYFTTASSLITIAYQGLYAEQSPITINNVFPISLMKEGEIKQHDITLKLFWFSQTIGKNRGIEDAINAIALLNKAHICITLLGNIKVGNKKYFEDLASSAGLKSNQLKFLNPISPNEIIKISARYDIGLALEPGFCLNNNIALSNKIFSYITSGLAIIASETDAQKAFLIENPSIGKSYPIGNYEILSKIINEFDENRALLNQSKLNSSALARKNYNWENESLKFIEIVKNTLA